MGGLSAPLVADRARLIMPMNAMVPLPGESGGGRDARFIGRVRTTAPTHSKYVESVEESPPHCRRSQPPGAVRFRTPRAHRDWRKWPYDFEALRRIKAATDPANVFRDNLNTPPLDT